MYNNAGIKKGVALAGKLFLKAIVFSPKSSVWSWWTVLRWQVIVVPGSIFLVFRSECLYICGWPLLQTPYVDSRELVCCILLGMFLVPDGLFFTSTAKFNLNPAIRKCLDQPAN